MLRFHTGGLLLASTACGITMSSAAAAQSAPDNPSTSRNAPAGKTAQSSKAGEIAEIIVTARRQKENAQRVPIAIDTVSQDTLQKNNIVDLNGLQTLIPSMSSATQTFSRDSVDISIRGQGSNFGGAPGVEAYLDEVPIPVQESGDLAGGPGLLFDLANVQVLKGPQGTLFGKNVVGGALLLETAKPTDDFGGHLQLGYGNYHNREFDGAINIPVSSELLTRTSFNGDFRNGFTRLLASPGHPNGVNVDDRHYWSVRENLTFKPIAGVRSDFVVGYSKFWDHSAAFSLDYVDPNGFLNALVYAGRTPSFLDLANEQAALGPRKLIPQSVDPLSRGSFFYASDVTSVALTDRLTLRNILGYMRTKYTTVADADSTAYAALDVLATPFTQRIDQLSEELQLQGRALDDRLNFTIGGFLLSDKNPDFQLKTQRVFDGPFTYQDLKNEASSAAVYGQANYDLSSLVRGLSVTAGLRYTRDYKALFERTAAIGNTAPQDCASTPRVNCDTIYKQHARFSATTYTLGLNYQASDKTLVYVTTRRGYRVGGFNTLATATGIVNLADYNPEYVTDYELGVKSDWNVGGVPIRTNADIYLQKWTGIQISQTQIFNNQGGAEQTVTANAGTARQWGAEFEAIARLTPAFTVGGFYDHLHLKYTHFEPGVNVSQAFDSLLVNRPSDKYGINAAYRLPIDPSSGVITLQANWAWQAKSGVVTQPGTTIHAFGLLNLNLGWERIEGTPFDVQLYMTNAFNKTYVVGVRPLAVFGFTSRLYGEPRMYGVRLNYHFGR